VLDFVLLAVAIAFNAAGQLMLKRATMGHAPGAGPREVFLSPWFLGGGAALGLSMVLWVLVLRRVPLTIAHPLTGSVFLIVPLASHLLWREPLSTTRLVGIGIIVVGIALVARGGLPEGP
jgi:undecaprenyl phosphate-alpha-L-ara4N flippase subunit ArnE